MRKFRFVLSLFMTLCLIIAASIRIADNPAIGKLLNPFTGFWNNAETSNRVLPEEVQLDQLHDAATVYFDERQIPHIFANNEHDLYFLQGYIVASLRLWQMEFQVLAAEGRISELIGESAIEFDTHQRRLGLPFGAKNKLKTIEEDELAMQLIGAYTEGVNAYISNLKKRDYPLEYKLMNYTPEPWSAYKTALLLMNMSHVLTGTQRDIENTNFVSLYGKELFDQMYKNWYPNVDPVISEPTWNWENSSAPDSFPVYESPIHITSIPSKDAASLYPTEDVRVGSNNWALSGDRTASGYPLLCNDPHLRLTFPSVWIEMHLSGPQSNAYGVVFAGAPGIVIGFNDHIGWGVTNAGRDVKDWYVIQFKDERKEEYLWDGEWLPTTKSIEEIKISGKESVYDTIIYTHIGPVTYEDYALASGEKVSLALEWMAHEGTQEYRTFYLLNRAENFDQYIDALTYYSCPAQNFVFASVDGDIALRQQGKFPILEKEQGRFIEDPRIDAREWETFIPFNHIPMEHNPKKGFVSSANQHAVDDTYPYYTNGVYEYYRNRVINTSLRRMYSANIDDMKALQYNNLNLKAKESLPTMLSYLSTFNMDFVEQEIYEALKNWNYWNDKGSKEATYYEIFSEEYHRLLWDEFSNHENIIPPNSYQSSMLLIDSIYHPFIQYVGRSEDNNIGDIITLAFKNTAQIVKGLDAVEWGLYKKTTIQHLARINAFSKTIDVGGNASIVNANSKWHGASWRMILDFSNGEIAGFGVYPGGQSGNPGSRYYDNMVDEWEKGEYHVLENASDKETYHNNESYYPVQFSTRSNTKAQ